MKFQILNCQLWSSLIILMTTLPMNFNYRILRCLSETNQTSYPWKAINRAWCEVYVSVLFVFDIDFVQCINASFVRITNMLFKGILLLLKYMKNLWKKIECKKRYFPVYAQSIQIRLGCRLLFFTVICFSASIELCLSSKPWFEIWTWNKFWELNYCHIIPSYLVFVNCPWLNKMYHTKFTFLLCSIF